MSAPTGDTDAPPDGDEAVGRVQELVDEDDGRTLQGVVYTGGETDYAHIYIAAVTGIHNGNRMLWLRYVWLSKPGAYENDMWGDNGVTIRMVDGMEQALPALVAAASNGIGGSDADPIYREA